MKASMSGRYLAFLFVLAFFADGAKAYTTGNESSDGTKRAFGDYTQWSPQNEDPQSTQFYADRTYYVRGSGGESIYVDSKCASTSFGGGTLLLGHSTQHGYLVLMRTYPDVLSVKNGEGLKIVHGSLVCAGSSNARYVFDGKLTASASSSANKAMISFTGNNSTLRIIGSIVSGNANAFHIGCTNAVAKTWRTGNRVELAGDCTGFSKEIKLYTKGAATSELTASPELTLAIGDTELPGTVSVGLNGALEPLEGKAAVVGTVGFYGNNWFNCTRGADKVSIGKIAVRNALTVSGGPVTVVASRAPLYDGRYAVLEFPSSSAAGKDDFVLKEDHNTEFCSLDFADDGEVKTLYLKYEGLPAPIDYVYQTVSSATLGESESWSDNTTTAQSGKHYALAPEGLTDGSSSATLKMPEGVYRYNFPGESLLVDSGCKLYFLQKTTDAVSFNCKRMDIMDNGSIGGGNKIPVGISGGVVNISGTAFVGTGSGRYVTINSKLAGLGCLRLCGHENGTSTHAKYRLEADNSGFRGTIDMTMLEDKNSTFEGNYSVLEVGSAKQLGGNLPALTRTALRLNDYAQLLTTGSIFLGKDSNRGIMVETGAQMLIRNPFTMETPLSLNGELRKLGSSTLVLKGAAAGFGVDGLSENPTEGKNIVSVRAGTLAIGSADAINGVAVTFESGTKLELQPDFGNRNLMDYGIRNVKAATPFALGEGVSSLPFSIGTATGKPASGVPFRLGLFTLKSGSSAVARVRSAVANIKYPIAGFKSKLVEIAGEEADTVTFAIDYTPIGFCLSIR